MDRKIEHKSPLRRRHIPFIVGGIIVVAVGAWAALGNHERTLRVEKKLLTISTVEQREFKDYVRVTGTVVPIEVVQISAIEGGVVTEKCVEEGARIRKGDVIIRLDNANLDLQILNAEAELAEKQNLLRNTQIAMQQDRLANQLELSQLDMENERKRRAADQQTRLYQEKLVAREDYLKAREDYDLATRKRALVTRKLRQDSLYRTAQMEQMEDNLAAMRRNVLLVRERKQRLEVRSTIDGELGLLDVKLGQNIAPGALIGQVNDLSAYKIEAHIDEHYIDRVRPGLTATLQRDGRAATLRIRKVFPEVRQGKFRVEFSFENFDKVDNVENVDKVENIDIIEKPAKTKSARPVPGGSAAGSSLRPGQTFYLDLALGQPSDAVIIPRGTFFQATGGQWIFVLSPDGRRAYRRPIRVGRQNPQHYEFLEGLSPGERVITSAYESFRDNEILQLE